MDGQILALANCGFQSIKNTASAADDGSRPSENFVDGSGAHDGKAAHNAESYAH
jgi:hypothetical protein